MECDYGRALSRRMDAQRFPEAAKLFGSNLFETMPEEGAAMPPGADPDFDFGLELILDGVATAVDAAR